MSGCVLLLFRNAMIDFIDVFLGNVVVLLVHWKTWCLVSGERLHSEQISDLFRFHLNSRSVVFTRKVVKSYSINTESMDVKNEVFKQNIIFL